MQKLLLILTTCVTTLFIGCNSIDLPKGTSEGYSSFRFVKIAPNTASDLAENTDDINGIIQQAITDQFIANSLQHSSGNAELIVAYLLIIQNNVSTARIDDYFGYGRSGSEIADVAHDRGVIKGNRPDYFEKGAIVIDVIDSKNDKLLYRNYAVRDIDGISDEQRQQLVKGAVIETLQAFFR